VVGCVQTDSDQDGMVLSAPRLVQLRSGRGAPSRRGAGSTAYGISASTAYGIAVANFKEAGGNSLSLPAHLYAVCR
jgi:hypothetical protein